MMGEDQWQNMEHAQPNQIMSNNPSTIMNVNVMNQDLQSRKGFSINSKRVMNVHHLKGINSNDVIGDIGDHHIQDSQRVRSVRKK
jgi:hypothetical protein